MKPLALLLAFWLPLSLNAQQVSEQQVIQPKRANAPALVRPYLPAEVPPVQLRNSSRFADLIRGGTMYLTLQDAIALALENNIDLEVSRYDRPHAEWSLERSQAGGALPGVPSGASQVNSVANGQGVAGSQASAGVGTNVGGNATGGGNATVAQIGPVTQTLDPIIQSSVTVSHQSAPQQNTVQSGVSNLITNSRVYTSSYQQGFLTGGSATLSYNEHYLNENAPSDFLNPSVAPALSLSFQHNLLRGFGTAVGGRTIEVSKINLATTDLNFKTQVIATVVNVLNSYYTLSADYEDLKSKRTALQTAQAFLEENRKRLALGALAPLDVTSSESQLASTEQDVVVAESSLRLDELTLKNLMSRTGVADPVLGPARLVPLDKIVMPAQDDLPPWQELVQKAIANRSDLEAQKARITTARISALGTANGVLPTAQVFASTSQAGLSGAPRFANTNPYFAGGIGNGLGQVFRRNFPTERIGVFATATIHNRQAQADQGIDQMQLRQTELTVQKELNQAQVDVMNSIVALKQARVRYEAAVQNRILQDKLLDAEQRRFGLGASTPYNVTQQQRDLATARYTELNALVSYSSARISLDQTTGNILEANHVSLNEARAGKVEKSSSLPADLPK